jgi:hypothetical protein
LGKSKASLLCRPGEYTLNADDMPATRCRNPWRP